MQLEGGGAGSWLLLPGGLLALVVLHELLGHLSRVKILLRRLYVMLRIRILLLEHMLLEHLQSVRSVRVLVLLGLITHLLALTIVVHLS